MRVVLLAALLGACGPGASAPGDGPALGKADSPEERAESVLAAIEVWNQDLSPGDRQAKFDKMAASPFIFYRGTNHLFWSDFAGHPALDEFGGEAARTWLQGDLHAENFGAYDNDRGQVVYSINDFDESVIADYQYDLWRMATSLVLIAEQNGVFDDDETAAAIDAFVESYLDAVAGYRGNDAEDSAIFTADNTSGLLDNFLRDTEEKNSRAEALEKWTTISADERSFDTSLERLAEVSLSERTALIAAMSEYGTTLSGRLAYDEDYFEVKDVAHRLLAGTGSLGTPRLYVLIEGETAGLDDDLILDVKRQDRPTPYVLLGSAWQDRYDDSFASDAERHAIAYKALAVHTDDHLGWLELSDGSYSVRERSVYKETLATDEIDDAADFAGLAEQWGQILATAHSRADKDFDATLVAYSFDREVDELTDGHHGDVRALVREIAFSYAAQVAADWRTFVDAIP